MANKSFVVQYILKVKDAYSAQAEKASASISKLTAKTREAKNAARGLNEAFISGYTARQRFSEQTTKNITLLDRLKSKMQSVNGEAIKEKLRGARNAGAIATAGITTPILYLAKGMKDAARDAVEIESKFDVVFSSIGIKASAAANKLAESYGMAGSTAKELMSGTGDILSGFGFTQDAALKMSEQVNQLAVDLVSFKNYSGGVTGASEALTKALLGERESLKSLGIAILEEDVKTRVKLLVKKGMRFETERQAKAYATLSLAMDQSKNAIGDYARTKESLANQERATEERMKTAREEIGKHLIPLYTMLSKAVYTLADKFIKLNPATQKTILYTVGLVAVIGPLILIIATLGLAIPPLIVGIKGIAAAFMFTGVVIKAVASAMLLNPIGLIITGIATAALLIYTYWEPIKSFFSGIWDYIGGKSMEFLSTIMVVINKVKELWTAGKQFFGGGGDLMQAATAGATGSLLYKNDLVDIGSRANSKNVNSKVDVNLNVGLDSGLKQTSKPAVSSNNVRRADVGGYAGAY